MTGSAYERELKSILEEKGWVVVRAAGSLGTGDIVAIDISDVFPVVKIIECKKTKDDRYTVSRKKKTKEQYLLLKELAGRTAGVKRFSVEYAVRYTQDKTWYFWKVPIETDNDWPVLHQGKADYTVEVK